MKKIGKLFILCLAVIAFGSYEATAETITFRTTGESIEIDAEGKPTDPQVRRIDPEEVDEKFWGIKLEDIEGELVRTKEGKTLYISEQGDLYMKGGKAASTATTVSTITTTTTVVPPLAVTPTPAAIATPLPDPAQHAAGSTTGTVAMPGGGNVRIVTDQTPGISMEVLPASAKAGDEILIKVFVSNAPQTPYTVGLSLGLDPNVLTVQRIDMAIGSLLVQQTVRDVNPDRQVVRLQFKRETTTDADSGVLATLVCRAVGAGETTLEPLSVEATARHGKTFIQAGDQVMRPTIRGRTITVR